LIWKFNRNSFLNCEINKFLLLNHELARFYRDLACVTHWKTEKLKKILIIGVFICAYMNTSAQIMYRTRYTTALMAEVTPSSVFPTLNIEYLPVRYQTSFISLRGGMGYEPNGNSSGVMFPTSVSYNFLFNNLRKRIFNRVYNKCKSAPSKIASEIFGEVGAGNLFSTYSNTTTVNRVMGIIGIRQQVIFDIPPKPRVVYVRVAFTPTYYTNKSLQKIEIQKGGISAGISF
jgi:hypothetical protein